MKSGLSPNSIPWAVSGVVLLSSLVFIHAEIQRRVMLIYPKTDRFTMPLKPFIFDDGLHLEVVPFDLENDCLLEINGSVVVQA